MNLRYLVFLTFLIIATLVGCKNDEASNFVTDKTFPTEKEAVNHFLQENPWSDVEHIKTTNDDGIFIVRSGNHQYSVYGMKNENKGYSMVKLTPTLSLHNTIAGSSEFTTTEGNDYTYLVVKKGKKGELYYNTRKYPFSPLYSGDAELSLSKGHILKNNDSSIPESVIQSTETIAEPNASS